MERADLAGLDVHFDRQWESTGGATVKIGRAGEKWVAWHSRRGQAWTFVHERAMADLADNWLARGQWREVAIDPASTVEACSAGGAASNPTSSLRSALSGSPNLR